MDKEQIREVVTALDDEFIEERRRGYKMNKDKVKWVRLDIKGLRETVIINVDKIDYLEPEINRIVVNGEGMTITQSCMDKLVEHIFKEGDL